MTFLLALLWLWQPRPERVAAEIQKARDILEDLRPENIFDSGFLVSAIYYHDGFLSGNTVANPNRRIVAGISRLLTPELKARYIAMLHELCAPDSPQLRPAEFIQPLRYVEGRKRRRRREHQYAIDLFAREGSLVQSATRGIVVLAEGGWTKSDLLSTSSARGGNAVIIFNPDSDRFFRYCHLGKALVAAGALVRAGQEIGTVGHTGLNAARRGHGGHLHFEVNQYDGRKVRALTYPELRVLLETQASP